MPPVYLIVYYAVVSVQASSCPQDKACVEGCKNICVCLLTLEDQIVCLLDQHSLFWNRGCLRVPCVHPNSKATTGNIFCGCSEVSPSSSLHCLWLQICLGPAATSLRQKSPFHICSAVDRCSLDSEAIWQSWIKPTTTTPQTLLLLCPLTYAVHRSRQSAIWPIS